MPHEGSAWSVASKPLMAWLNQNEWSKATARVNSCCAAALQDVEKLTVPSFSGTCWAPADTAKSRLSVTTMAAGRMVRLLSHWLVAISFSSGVTLATVGWRVNDVASAVVSRASGESLWAYRLLRPRGLRIAPATPWGMKRIESTRSAPNTGWTRSRETMPAMSGQNWRNSPPATTPHTDVMPPNTEPTRRRIESQ